MQDLSFFSGTEAWVGDFLKLLPQERSILRNYTWNAAHITHANAGFHVGVGLILLSQIAPTKGIRLSSRSKPSSNIFVLNLAPTGQAKTESIHIGETVGKEAGLITLTTNPPGSREGLIDSLDDQHPDLNGRPKQALLYPEFADFLSITTAGGRGRSAGHAATMRASFMAIFDGGSATRVLAAARNRETGEVHETKRGTETPVVSMIGAANYRVLTQHTTEDDWHSGFVGRYLMIDGEMERYYPQVQPWPDSMQNVIDVIRWRLMLEQNRYINNNPLFPLPSEDREYGAYYPDARARMDRWATDMHLSGRSESNGLVAAALPRLQPLCARIATLLCFDFGEASGLDTGGVPLPGWRIGLREVEAAIYLTERHLQSYRYAASHVVLNEEERPIRDVETALRRADAGGRMLTEGQISADTARTMRTVGDALVTLMSRGVVRKVQPAEGTPGIRYQIVDGFTDKVVALYPTVQPAIPAVASATAAPRLIF